jgi:hypothetical protein
MTGTLKTFTFVHTEGQKCSDKSAGLGLYLERFAKPGDCLLDVQGG